MYSLSRPAELARLHELAASPPVEHPARPVLHRRPLAVWGNGMPDTMELNNALRTVSLRLHVAGGAAARLGKVDAGAAWLRARYPGQTLPADGAPVSITLALHPATLRPGTYRATVSVPLRFAGGSHQTLQHSLCLTVPQGAVPWFEQAALSFAGTWPLRSVRIGAAAPVAVLCGGGTISPAAPSHALNLYPAAYELLGAPGTLALVEMGNLDRQLRAPAAWRVPGPMQAVLLYNLGSAPLVGRLMATVPWLCVTPEFIDLPPGQTARVAVECFDDGRYWQERSGSVELQQHRGEAVLARLPVERSPAIPGPQPVLLTASVRFPPVTPGGTTIGTVEVRNGGDRPLHVGTDAGAPALSLAPGEAKALAVRVGPPETERPGFQTGDFALATDGSLPFWHRLRVPYEVAVVQATLETREINFGDVPYKQNAHAALRVLRSDQGRSSLKLDLPAELAGTLYLVGEQIHLRNQQPRPLTIDAELVVSAPDLGDAPLGRVRVRGRCLVPRLEVHVPSLQLVPGQSATVALQLRDAGGGLELHSVQADQPWVTLRRAGSNVAVEVETNRRQRGRLEAVLLFLSNDYTQPRQEHRLLVVLTPTRWMRVQDWLLVLWRRVQGLGTALWQAARRILRRAR